MSGGQDLLTRLKSDDGTWISITNWGDASLQQHKLTLGNNCICLWSNEQNQQCEILNIMVAD